MSAVLQTLSRRTPLALPLAAAACGPGPDSARGAAQGFLDAHHVRVDPRGAGPSAAGLARRQLEREIAPVGGQAIDAGTRTPSVDCTLVEERRDGEAAAQLPHAARITVDDADPLERRWLLTVRRAPEGPRVVSREELADR